jgi:UDP-glucose 4-epimerase
MKHVLVTGAAGFIGSHVAEEFFKEGYEVTALDNLSRGRRENLDPKIRLITADICEDLFSNSELKNAGNFDLIVHHAACIDVRKSVEDPVKDAQNNIMGTLNLLEYCRKKGIYKIIYASTGGAIYGNPGIIPTTEDAPANPDSPYGESKFTVERYLKLYNRLYGIDYCALRYSNVYGPRQFCQGEGGVVAVFISRMLKHMPVIINGDGNQTRDFVYVKDVAAANVLAAKTKSLKKVINIGTGKETSINQLFRLVCQSLDYQLKPQNRPPIKGEIKRSAVDITLAREYLNWKPKTDIIDGLRLTIKSMK